MFAWAKIERQQLNNVEASVKLNFNSDKTEVLVIGPHAPRSKLSDYITSLCSLSVSCAPYYSIH